MLINFKQLFCRHKWYPVGGWFNHCRHEKTIWKCAECDKEVDKVVGWQPANVDLLGVAL